MWWSSGHHRSPRHGGLRAALDDCHGPPCCTLRPTTWSREPEDDFENLVARCGQQPPKVGLESNPRRMVNHSKLLEAIFFFELLYCGEAWIRLIHCDDFGCRLSGPTACSWKRGLFPAPSHRHSGYQRWKNFGQVLSNPGENRFFFPQLLWKWACYHGFPQFLPWKWHPPWSDPVDGTGRAWLICADMLGNGWKWLSFCAWWMAGRWRHQPRILGDATSMESQKSQNSLTFSDLVPPFLGHFPAVPKGGRATEPRLGRPDLPPRRCSMRQNWRRSASAVVILWPHTALQWM